MVDGATVGEDCEDCKWWISGGVECLLGRSPDTCGRNPARRGDDELAARILDLTADGREEAVVRFDRAARALREDDDRAAEVRRP